jgi:hypothetical protein
MKTISNGRLPQIIKKEYLRLSLDDQPHFTNLYNEDGPNGRQPQAERLPQSAHNVSY